MRRLGVLGQAGAAAQVGVFQRDLGVVLLRDPADSAPARGRWVSALRRHACVVYAKTPLAGPAAVLEYFSRYPHRTAIGNERLVGIAGEHVRLRVRVEGQANGRGKRTIAMPGEQFIGRLLHPSRSRYSALWHQQSSETVNSGCSSSLAKSPGSTCTSLTQTERRSSGSRPR